MANEKWLIDANEVKKRIWSEVKIDEDELDESYYEFEFNYCPNCGAKMVGDGNG